MKPTTIKFACLTSGKLVGAFVFLPFVAAQAIEPPPDDARPPAAILGKSGNNEDGQSIPYLGVATAKLPDMVAQHLDIEAGTGVIIRTVCPDSPAAKAGLSANDIILSIAGQAVSDPNQLTASLRKHKVGERVSLDLIHKGKPSKVEIILTERPSDEMALLNQSPLLEGMPEDHAQRLRDLIEQNLKAIDPQLQGNPFFADPQFDGAFRMLKERMDEMPSEEPQGNLGFQSSSTVRISDNEGSIEMKTQGENTEVTVSDATNNIVWSGPWNTDEDKAAAPEDIRNRIERINGGGGFSFRFRQPILPKNGD